MPSYGEPMMVRIQKIHFPGDRTLKHLSRMACLKFFTPTIIYKSLPKCLCSYLGVSTSKEYTQKMQPDTTNLGGYRTMAETLIKEGEKDVISPYVGIVFSGDHWL